MLGSSRFLTFTFFLTVFSLFLPVKNSQAQAFPECPNPTSFNTNVHVVRHDADTYLINLNHFHTNCKVLGPSGTIFINSYTIDSLTLLSSPLDIRPRLVTGTNSFSMDFSDTGYLALNGTYRFQYNVKFYVKSATGGYVPLAYQNTISVVINNGVNPPSTVTPTLPPVQPTVTPVAPYTAPYATVTVTSPAAGQVVSGIVPVTFTVSNLRAFTITSVGIRQYTSELSGSTRSIPLDTRLMPEGTRSIAVRVSGTDMRGDPAYFFGNVLLDVRNGPAVQPTPVSPQIADSVFPLLTISGLPENGQTVSGKLNFTVSASDNFGLKTLEVFGFGGSQLSKNFMDLPASQSQSFSQSFTIDTKNYPDGTYQVNVTATDRNSTGNNPNGNPTSAVRIFSVSNADTAGANPSPTPTAAPGDNQPVATPAPQPGTPSQETIGALIHILSEMIAQLTELMKQMLKITQPTTEQAKLTKSVAKGLSEVTSINKEQFESNEQTQFLPAQAKSMNRSIKRALKQAKNNDKAGIKSARKELNKTKRLLKKITANLD